MLNSTYLKSVMRNNSTRINDQLIWWFHCPPRSGPTHATCFWINSILARGLGSGLCPGGCLQISLEGDGGLVTAVGAVDWCGTVCTGTCCTWPEVCASVYTFCGAVFDIVWSRFFCCSQDGSWFPDLCMAGFEPERELATVSPLQDNLSLNIRRTGGKCPPKSKLNGRSLCKFIPIRKPGSWCNIKNTVFTIHLEDPFVCG